VPLSRGILIVQLPVSRKKINGQFDERDDRSRAAKRSPESESESESESERARARARALVPNKNFEPFGRYRRPSRADKFREFARRTTNCPAISRPRADGRAGAVFGPI
jgi:hypothetical protein